MFFVAFNANEISVKAHELYDKIMQGNRKDANAVGDIGQNPVACWPSLGDTVSAPLGEMYYLSLGTSSRVVRS